jgi:hypothetical protein
MDNINNSAFNSVPTSISTSDSIWRQNKGYKGYKKEYQEVSDSPVSSFQEEQEESKDFDYLGELILITPNVKVWSNL